jgi:hemerythrin
MGWIKWDDMLELGLPAMDAEHRQLVDLVNQLAKAVLDPSEKETYDKLLDELFACTKEHFGTEERLMAAHGYPNATEHTSEHAKLIQDALAFRDKFAAGAEPSVSLLYFFDQWLSRHIVTWDRDLADFITASK